MRSVLICLLLSLVFAIAGCNTDNSNTLPDKNKQVTKKKNSSYQFKLKTMLGEMNAAKKPQNHINSIRRYALDNFSNLTKEEYNLITKTKPRIYKDNNTLEYSFAWKLPDNKGCLQVLATPPPDCTPIAVFRRNEVYFP